MIHFAATVLEQPLDPWQQWAVIHLGELLPDGRPRFRQVLVLVARQNGKTHLCKVLTLFWMFVEKWPLVFGSSTSLDTAKEPWQECVDLAEDVAALRALMPAKRSERVRFANGEQTLRAYRITLDGRRRPGPRFSRYKIGAANRRGGRGLSIDRIIGDELREHHTWEAYKAAYNAMNARPYGQAVFITNQGDAKAVVLKALRKAAIEGSDERIGLLEWSAAPGTHPMDPAGWAAANPQIGRRMDYDTVRSAAIRVSKPGADPEDLAGFLTETLCMSVDSLDPAIDMQAWQTQCQPAAMDVTGRTAGFVDVSPDLQHATLAVAQLAGQVSRVEVVQAWEGPRALQDMAEDLPAAVRLYRMRALGWLPGGPAAAADAMLRDRSKSGKAGWPPRGVLIAEVRGDAPAVCMGFAQRVGAGAVLHSGQELLDEHARRADKLVSGGRWVFVGPKGQHVDALYAAAGADHLVRTMPTPRKLAGPSAV